jgi:hypothetical protein
MDGDAAGEGGSLRSWDWFVVEVVVTKLQVTKP